MLREGGHCQAVPFKEIYILKRIAGVEGWRVVTVIAVALMRDIVVVALVLMKRICGVRRGRNSLKDMYTMDQVFIQE